MRCPANAAGAGQGALISDRDPASARILILCHGGGGGSTRAAVDLAAALDRRGRRIALATVGHPAWAAPVRHHVLPVPAGAPGRPDRPWPAGAIEALAARLAALCRIERPDVLHVHYAQPLAAVAGQAAALLGQDAPGLVVTLHGSDLTGVLDDALRRRSLVDDLAPAAAVSTVSEAYARLASGVLGRVPAVVPNFLPRERVPPPVRRQPGRRWPLHRRPGRLATILHISSFRPVKEPRAALRTFLAVRRRRRCRLLLLGGGPGLLPLRPLLKERDVRVLGFRRDVGPILAQADLLLLTARTESFGLAALEAMAAGVPVVAARVGGLPEVVGDGGLLFHPGRSADAAGRILGLLASAARRRALAARARRRAAGFDEAGTVAGYDRLYAGTPPPCRRGVRMKGLAELLGDGAGRDRLAAAGIHVDPAAFLAAMPAGPPARIYCHQQPAADPRRSVMAKLTALDGLRWTRPDGVEPLFLRIDTDRAASAKAATRLAWEDAAGRRHLLKLTPPGTDRLESRHLQLDPQQLAAVAARLEAYVRQAAMGRQEALARLHRIRPLLAPGHTMPLSHYAAALSDWLLARVDVRLPTAFVSELAAAGALTGGLTRLLAGRDAFVAAFDRAVDDLRQAGIATAVSPLPDDYLPLFYSCPHEGERLRLRRVVVGGEIQAVAVGTTGRRHVFPLGRRGDDPGSLLATQRWSPDVTLPVLLNDTFDGVVAGRSSALYLMVLAAAMRAALGMRPIPVLVPAELGTVPERPDGLLQRWLMG